MISLFSNRGFTLLFAAQLAALTGTGVGSIALGLMAYDLAGGGAGLVLGVALAIRSLANCLLAPLAAALVERLPRKPVLVTLELTRMAVIACFPWITEVWQIFLGILLLQACAACLVPVIRAILPSLVRDERDYTRALSLVQLSYDMENITSPLIAALLLQFVSYPVLFYGTAGAFLFSASLMVSAAFPPAPAARTGGLATRIGRGLWLFLGTPRLRAYLAVCVAAALGSAMVLVNTVVRVQEVFGLGPSETAQGILFFGLGSICAALAAPHLLTRVSDRPTVLAGAAILAIGLFLGAFVARWPSFLMLQVVLGVGYGLTQMPAGRLVRRSSTESDRAGLFASHYALSHVCWAVAYPLAGWLGSAFGLPAASAVLGALAAAGAAAALLLWPRDDAAPLLHAHPELPRDHPHLAGAQDVGGVPHHGHEVMLDDLHPVWPKAPLR